MGLFERLFGNEKKPSQPPPIKATVNICFSCNLRGIKTCPQKENGYSGIFRDSCPSFSAIAITPTTSNGEVKIDTICPGCGRRLRNLSELEAHASRCKKLIKVMLLSYDIPVVDMRDLAKLEAKLLPNNKEWGIWNVNANDWVRDKTGQIDGRVFQRNIKKLLKSVIAASIIANAKNNNSD